MSNLSHSTISPSLFRSPTVKILVGQERVSLNVHVAVLQTSGSGSLQALVSEKWNLSGNPIDWTSWDLATVERVLTWLYGRSYEIPTPALCQPMSSETEIEGIIPDQLGELEVNHPSRVTESQSSEINVEAVSNVGIEETVATRLDNSAVLHVPNRASHAQQVMDKDDADHVLQSALIDSYISRPLTPLTQYVKRPPTHQKSHQDLLGFDESLFPSSTHAYLEPLLALVRLHHFAIYHLCDSLQQSTFHQLLRVMESLDCSRPHVIHDLMQLIRYAYSEIPADIPSHGSIRNMLTQFTALNYPQLMHSGFREFVFEEGDFSIDVARKISRRLLSLMTSSEAEIDKLQIHLKQAKAQVGDLEVKVSELKSSYHRCKKCRRFYEPPDEYPRGESVL